MKEISIPSSILQYIPKEWHINPCQNMQPPYRSWLMHCSSLEPLQNCFTFCNSASQFNPSKRKLRYPPAQERWRTRTSSQVQWSKTKWTWSVQQIGEMLTRSMWLHLQNRRQPPLSAPSCQHIAKNSKVWTLYLSTFYSTGGFRLKRKGENNWLHTTHCDTRNRNAFT